MNAHQKAEKKNNLAIAGERMKIHLVEGNPGQQYSLNKQDLAKNQPDIMDNAPDNNNARKNGTRDKRQNNGAKENNIVQIGGRDFAG